LVRETNGPILDVACGSGQLTLALLNRGYDVGGIDNLESMIERAKSEIALVEYNSVMEVQDMRNFRLEKE
jgi:2-polyprenyl-3-methyl-5-hydroxy-6-metoxy-1,4-benzoquinol methylase